MDNAAIPAVPTNAPNTLRSTTVHSESDDALALRSDAYAKMAAMDDQKVQDALSTVFGPVADAIKALV